MGLSVWWAEALAGSCFTCENTVDYEVGQNVLKEYTTNQSYFRWFIIIPMASGTEHYGKKDHSHGCDSL